MNHRDRLGELQRIAQERGGQVVTNSYTDSRTPLMWQCAEGYRWWLGKRGDAHPCSRPVLTPLERFRSIGLAAEAQRPWQLE